jgi:hypothetical protein
VPLGLGWVTPSFLLLVVLCLSMEYSNLDFFVFALAGGLWMDIYFGLPLGAFTGAYLIVGLSSFIIFQQAVLIERRLRYYFIFTLAAEIFLMIWLWLYTNILHGAHWSSVAISGNQLLRHSVILILIGLIVSFPIYALITWIARVSKQFWHQPLRL